MECIHYLGLKVGDRVDVELIPPYRIQYRPTFFTVKKVTTMRNLKVTKIYPERIVVAFTYKEFSMCPKYGTVLRSFDRRVLSGKIINIAKARGISRSA